MDKWEKALDAFLLFVAGAIGVCVLTLAYLLYTMAQSFE